MGATGSITYICYHIPKYGDLGARVALPDLQV